MKKEKKTRYGGQAVFEGVMMRGKNSYAMAVRHIDGDIKIKEETIKTPKKSFKSLPIIRGIFSFISSMSMGMDLLNDSFIMAGFEDIEEEPTKFELWLEKIFKEKTTDILMGFSMFIGVLLSIGLFVFLPTFLASLLDIKNPRFISLVEGIIRLVIFFIYLISISQMDDIHRVLAYHGAEHKTINCYEKGLPLTIENIKKQSRLHKRCGTSFLFLVMFISILFFSLLQVEDLALRFIIKVLCIPLVAGISYEVLQWAGRSDSILVDIVSFPGLMSQKLTTKEPDSEQIEVAVKALELVLEKDGVLDEDYKYKENLRENKETI